MMTKRDRSGFSLSYSALDRMCQEHLATHPSLVTPAAGASSLKAGRAMSDEQLLARLRQLGLTVDRELLAGRVADYPSAEALSEALVREAGIALPDTQEADWPWICIAVLWERWFPDEPSFEMLDERIACGYDLKEKGDCTSSADVWLKAWRDVKALARKANTCERASFDEAFGGYQSVFNWCQNVPEVLWTAGLADPAYLRKRIEYGQSLLSTFPDLDDSIAQNTRRFVAETYFKLGEPERGDDLFRAWLAADPRWGWGWIGWSDCHAWPCFGIEDSRRAEQILREGLAVAGVRDRSYLLDRLRNMREQPGDAGFADTVGGADAPDQSGPVRSRSVGRNAPCPCGSGKKYKKCCLVTDEASRRKG